MPTSRREFLATSISAVGALSLGAGLARAVQPKDKAPAKPGAGPLKILILGGTGFLGPHVVDAAQARGHTVTLFNRGITEKRKGGLFPEVEKLQGDRDPKKGEGLSALKGRSWDAVVDTSGYYPRMVAASAELLADAVRQYVFISTLSVYADNNTPDADESAAVGTIPDPSIETMSDGAYGPLKALCEQAAEKAMPGRVLNIRPGYIVGPGDTSDRFTYWPMRAKRGGEILAPGNPEDPVQIIDARDLARWIVRCIEQRTVGVFNACGPVGGLTTAAMIEACRKAAGSESTLTWVETGFLANQGVGPGVLPIWLPQVDGLRGFHRRKFDKAVAAGLTSTPVEQTARDVIAWFPGELERRIRVTRELIEQAEKDGKPKPAMADPAKPRAGISPEKEAEVLKAWKARPQP